MINASEGDITMDDNALNTFLAKRDALEKSLADALSELIDSLGDDALGIDWFSSRASRND